VSADAIIERLAGAAVVEHTPMAGGDLSGVARVTLADGRTIVAKSGPSVASEARMLAALAANGAPAPAVIAIENDLLLMTCLPADGHLSGSVWDDLAAVLGDLHRPRDQPYGWEEDYAFGPVAIVNRRETHWSHFWAAHRLRCHLAHIPPAIGRRIERLVDRLDEHLPDRPPPALLHGDLWGGNVLVSGGRISGLIDPACYLGDREVDVAMLTLFDRPPPSFFDALDLAPGWRERLPVYRLWPLLVHLRLFGGGYLAPVERDLASLGA